MKMGRVYVVQKMFAGYVAEPNPLDALNKLEELNEALKDENKVSKKTIENFHLTVYCSLWTFLSRRPGFGSYRLKFRRKLNQDTRM